MVLSQSGWLGVEFLGAATKDFAKYRQHARMNRSRLVNWNWVHVPLLEAYWGGQLRELIQRHRKVLPRLEMLTSDVSIPAEDRTFSYMYCWEVLLDAQGGAQLRSAAADIRPFMQETQFDTSKGFAVAADTVE